MGRTDGRKDWPWSGLPSAEPEATPPHCMTRARSVYLASSPPPSGRIGNRVHSITGDLQRPPTVTSPARARGRA